MYRSIFSFVLLMVILVSCKKPKDNYSIIIPSPDGQLHLHFNLHKGEPYYLVYLDDEIVVGWSLLGFKNDSLAKGISSGESLQENMLAMEVGPILIEDDIPLILAGEKYNSLKVHLQKEGDRKIGYNVVFLIYNETIVFWYEYDSDLRKLRPNFKENTEFDLNNKNQEWQVIETIPKTDTLILPAIFKSDMGINVTFSEINSEKNNGGYLLQRGKNLPEFLVSAKSTDILGKINDQPSIVKTEKRSIHIYRNK